MLLVEENYSYAISTLDSLRNSLPDCGTDMSDLFVNISNAMLDLKTSSVDYVIGNVNDYINNVSKSCGINNLPIPHIGNVSSKINQSIQLIESGPYFNEFSELLNNIDTNLSCSQIYQILETLLSKIFSKINIISSLSSILQNFKSLQDDIITALGIMGMLLSCGQEIVDGAYEIKETIGRVSLNTRYSIEAVEQAVVNNINNPKDILSEAKSRLVSVHNFDGRMESIHNDLTNTINELIV